MGGSDVELTFCDMHVFHFSKVYFCTTCIFKNAEKQNFISEYTFTSVQKNEEYVHPRKTAEPLLLWRN